MTMIGLDVAATEATGGVRLHSCPSCGRHAWRQGEREVGRAELLAALTARPTTRRLRVPEPAELAPPEPVVDEVPRRQELQRLLAGFTVHGASS